MIIKNKVLDKILKIYLLIFAMFSLLSVNIVINDILINYNIYNQYTSYIVLLITVSSFMCMLYTVDKWNEDKGDENK